MRWGGEHVLLMIAMTILMQDDERFDDDHDNGEVVERESALVS